MSGYQYGGGNPPYQNQIYPQLYNPSNAPIPGSLSYPAQPGQNPSFPPQPAQPGFAQYPYPQQPIIHPAPTMTYPGQPSAPSFAFGYPTTTQHPPSTGGVEWIPSTPRDANQLSNRAVVGGYEGYDGSPLWVIRARHEGDLIPGKLAIKHNAAYVPWNGKENAVSNIEVCCAPADRVRWVTTTGSTIPQGAIIGGNTSSGESLYIGRAKEKGSLTPGKVHPSHGVIYMSFGGKEIPHKSYEILCQI